MNFDIISCLDLDEINREKCHIKYEIFEWKPLKQLNSMVPE